MSFSEVPQKYVIDCTFSCKVTVQAWGETTVLLTVESEKDASAAVVPLHDLQKALANLAENRSHKADNPAAEASATEPCCGGCGRECEHCAGLCLACQSYWEEHLPPAISHKADNTATEETQR